MSRLCARLLSSLSLIASLLFLLGGFSAPAARAQYTAPTDIPSQAGGSTAQWMPPLISKNGIVVGVDYAHNTSCVFIWQNGVTTDLLCAPTSYASPNVVPIAVNNSGVVLAQDSGNLVTVTATGPEVHLSASVPPTGTDPVSGSSFAVNGTGNSGAIDNNGDVVGFVGVNDQTTQANYNEAVLWPAGGGTPVFLGPFQPIAINDNGQVMGSDNNGNGWFYAPGNTAMQIGDLGFPGQVSPSSLNSSGQVAGTAASAANGGNPDNFLWSIGTGMADLGPNPVIPTPLLNDGGVMVGSFPISIFNLSGVQAESWTSNNGFQQMQSLDGGGPGGLNTDTPAAINAVSQVVGQGYFNNGGQQAEYWANITAQPLALGAGQITAISDNGWGAGVDYMTGNAAVWPLNGQVIGASGAPTIDAMTPGNNATYDVGEIVPVIYSCNSPDGISSCSAQDSLGNTYPPGSIIGGGFSDLDTNVAGNFTMTYTAVSDAGVTATQTVNYSVVSSATQITGAKMRGYGALAADQLGDLYRFTMNIEDTQQGAQAGRFDLWSVDKNGFPRVAAIFDADSITSVNFTNTGLLGTNKKGQLLADTVTFQGTGEYNDQPGYTITVTATDAGNPGVGVDSMNIAITDPNGNPVSLPNASGLLDAGNISSTRLGKTPPPVFTDGPPPVTQLEATGPSGAVATFDAPAAVDYNGNTIANATCSPASGSTFPLGVTHGTCTATDSNGRTSAIRFRVHVKDTTPPVISNVPQSITVQATAANGAMVTYTLPTATDTVDPSPTITCAKPSGATFAITTTTVVCTAKDASGNKSQATFTVTVTDTIPPKITIASPSGSYSLNEAVTASYACTDAQSGVATCSGPVANGAAIDTSTAGSYSFTVTSTDNAGNTATKTSTYTVKKK